MLRRLAGGSLILQSMNQLVDGKQEVFVGAKFMLYTIMVGLTCTL